MQNAAGSGFGFEHHDHNDTHQAVVTELVGLIEHVQSSLRLIEQAIVRETSPGSQENLGENPGENSRNVIVLDDVSPRYVKAGAALKACDANLGIALHSLLDSSTQRRGLSAYTARPPAFSIVGT